MIDRLTFGLYVLLFLALFGWLVAALAFRIAPRVGIFQSRNFWRFVISGIVVLQGAVYGLTPLFAMFARDLVATNAHGIAGAWLADQWEVNGTGILIGAALVSVALIISGGGLASWIARLRRPSPPRIDPDDVIFGR